MLATTEAYGLRFQYPAGDSAVGASLRDFGEFARPELDFLIDHAAQDSGAFLDIGANIGAIGLPFAAERPRWRVVAVEALTGLASLLTTNAAQNDLANVAVLHAAAGPEAGLVDFPHVNLTAKGNFGNLGFNYPASERRPVPMVTLDGISSADTRIVKIDVQGFEPSVLRGAARLRQEVRPLWLVEAASEWRAAASEVVAMLRADGYQLYWFFSPFATPGSPRARPADPFKGDTSVVALPEGVPNTWNLTAVRDASEPAPSDIRAYPYLARYAYEAQ